METAQSKTFRIAFNEAIDRYLNTVNQVEARRAKDEIINLVKYTKDPDARRHIKEVIAESGFLSVWLDDHFTPGSVYIDRGLVMGWWRDDQLQAESLPVELSKNYFKIFDRRIEVVANRNGFRRAMPLPLVEGSPTEWPCRDTVCVPEFQPLTYGCYGWANAEPLQWRRDGLCIIVDRSILVCGFWAPWKWWPGAGEFYKNNPPYPLCEKFDYCGESAVDFWMGG